MILIVDDNSAIREMVEEVLATSGYAVRTAASGEDALVLMESKLPGLVLLDLTMPGMSGYQTLKQIHQRFPDDNIPVVFVSAYPAEEEREHAMDMGASDYISKPFQFPDLLQCVQTYLRKAEDGGQGIEDRGQPLTSGS